MKRVLRSSAFTLVATSILAACGGAEEDPAVEADAPAATEPVAQAGGMEGMQGMDGMASMQQGGIAAQLQGHMQMMQGASGDQLKQMLPEHRQLVANMIAQMNREMRDMEMSDNTEWNQTVTALRDDLVRLPDMAPEELRSFMPEHQARIDRLIAMHKDMMGSMQM
ncbi:MAG: hypothetical protein AB1941_01175 [Gemmatimonadota bacterium]